MKKCSAIILSISILCCCCTTELVSQGKLDQALIKDLELLSSATMEGRKPGTIGHAKARDYIIDAFKDHGLMPVDGKYVHKFDIPALQVAGKNILAVIPGNTQAAIVVSAHYDHLGTKKNEIFYGADDNASGTAALLYLAKYFIANPLNHTIIFAAFDAEESGLLGAKYFVENYKGDIVYNVNMDMIARGDKQEIYACGTAYNPKALPIVQYLNKNYANISVKAGHDQKNSAQEDWTFSSDHGPFHKKGIPFVYFGVEDHADYHRATDTFDKIKPAFFTDVVHMIADFIKLLDKKV